VGENHEKLFRFPGFPARGTYRGNYVPLSSRKAACGSMAPASSTRNPGSVYTNCETAVARGPDLGIGRPIPRHNRRFPREWRILVS
jgi:hypothetical protein